MRGENPEDGGFSPSLSATRPSSPLCHCVPVRPALHPAPHAAAFFNNNSMKAFSSYLKCRGKLKKRKSYCRKSLHEMHTKETPSVRWSKTHCAFQVSCCCMSNVKYQCESNMELSHHFLMCILKFRHFGISESHTRLRQDIYINMYTKWKFHSFTTHLLNCEVEGLLECLI